MNLRSLSGRVFGLVIVTRSRDWGGGRILWISSNGDERSFFLGLKSSILGFLRGREICKVYFGVA